MAHLLHSCGERRAAWRGAWPLAAVSYLMLSACSGGTAGGLGGRDAPSAAPLAGASAAPRVQTSGQPRRNQCDAKGAQGLIGQRVGPATLADAIAAAGADEARVLAADAMTTKEYKLGRLNVTVDADERIVSIYCG